MLYLCCQKLSKNEQTIFFRLIAYSNHNPPRCVTHSTLGTLHFTLQDIIHMYKMQQQLGSFAKMKSREELEVPTYTTTVPVTTVPENNA